MTQIDCQACGQANVPDGERKSCAHCGGYGLVMFKVPCSCGQPYWARPHAFTSYPGKTWRSIDGLKLIDQGPMQGGIRCEKCVPGIDDDV